MSRLIISNRAELDLRLIWLYVAAENPEAADRLVEELVSLCRGIPDMPRRGSPRDLLRPGLRSIPCGQYVVFYREITGGVEIARVMHGSRDIESAIED